MRFKPTTWYPVAAVLSLLNLVAAGFAAGQAQPEHATIHVVAAVAFGLWAQRLRQRSGRSELQASPEALDALEGLDALEAEMTKLRQELSETQERLDFTERMLARGSETRRVDPER
jgi:hypothetical protein